MPSDPPDFAAHLAEELSPEDFIQVLTLVSGDVEQLVASLETAAGAGDADACRAAAHGLAGAAGVVGAEALEKVSRRAMTNRDPAASLTATAAEIRSVANATLRQIAAVLAGGAPPVPS
jgi:HPt (histidine-containing phosphotransfer) domain-containing protein